MLEEDIHELIYVSDELRHDLMETLISPYYRQLIADTLTAKKFYKRLGMVLETSSKVFVAGGSILSFATGYYDDEDKLLSVFAGSVGALSLGLMQVASFSYKEHLRLSKELNSILHKLKIETLPIMHRSVTETTEEPRQRRASVVVSDGMDDKNPMVIC